MSKSGKTTISSKFEKNLLIAFERGFNAIPGAMAQPVTTWGEFKKILRQLKDPTVQEKFYNITIDTVDLAYDACEKYICNNAGVDKVGDIPYGAGYGMVAKEFDECLRSIVQLNYGLIMISHSVDKTFTDENGVEYNQIVPTLGAKPRNIVARMADIIGYSRTTQDLEGNVTTKLYMRGTPRFLAGSRFPYTPFSIDFTYENLCNAIKDSIDKQMAETGEEYFKENRNNLYEETSKPLDFDALMAEFTDIIKGIKGSDDLSGTTPEGKYFREYWLPRITQIVEQYLGKGKKIKDATRDQVEAIDLIVMDLKELVK